jgi:hypothetical protein
MIGSNTEKRKFNDYFWRIIQPFPPVECVFVK